MPLAENRFTIGGLNPNDVAVFIVVVMLSLPALLHWSKRWFWAVASIETLLVGLLVGTGSRGGVLALLIGGLAALVVAWLNAQSSLSRKTWFIIAMAVLVGGVGGLVVFPKSYRLGSFDVSPEASAGRRLEVWSKVPAMLASNPGGWGIGKSAEAYEQWFEPVGVDVDLKHLLSSHLTWLTEIGWPLRWLYLFFWMAAITLLMPSSRFRFPPWVMAAWIALFVGLFYNAAGKWWNWPLPFLLLFAALIWRARQKAPPSARSLLWCAGISTFLVILPFGISWIGKTNPKIAGENGLKMVTVGEGSPRVAIFGPSHGVLGAFYGQEIRRQWRKPDRGGALVVIAEPDAVTIRHLEKCRLYLFSGIDQAALDGWKRQIKPDPKVKLILINCRVEPDDWTKAFGGVLYVHGAFYGDPFYNLWKELSMENSSVLVKDIPGHEAYIPSWGDFLDSGGESVTGIKKGM